MKRLGVFLLVLGIPASLYGFVKLVEYAQTLPIRMQLGYVCIGVILYIVWWMIGKTMDG